ncbi:hypothetical protein V2A60_004377 [Cordyceps javanica]
MVNMESNDDDDHHIPVWFDGSSVLDPRSPLPRTDGKVRGGSDGDGGDGGGGGGGGGDGGGGGGGGGDASVEVASAWAD